MVAGSHGWLGDSDFPREILICQGAYMQLVCVYFAQTWLCGVLLINHGLLAYTSVLDWYSSKIWLPVIDWPALIAHLIPKSDQSHNMYLEFFLMKINNCHLRWWGLHTCYSQAEGHDWPAWKTKSRQWKATVQKLLWGSPGTPFNCKLATIRLDLELLVWGRWLWESQKGCNFLGEEAVLQINFLAKEDF